jgi:hypothetical protein
VVLWTLLAMAVIALVIGVFLLGLVR